MEAIKNYLESMFANLPNTAEVQRAKAELMQMMEDKYTSLLEEGKKENEAVGIVISEFGNLNEIAETLGISNVMGAAKDVERRHVTREEAEQFVADRGLHHFFIGLGVMFCIISPISAIFFDGIYPEGYGMGEAIGVSGLFTFVAIAVAIFIYASFRMNKWDFIKKMPCSIDYQTADELYLEQKRNRSSKTLFLTIGVILCIISLIPVSVMGSLPLGRLASDVFGPIVMFIMIGIGVMFIIFSNGRDGAYTILLGLNDSKTVSGSYESTRTGSVKYTNKTIEGIMSVYWPTVRNLYLIWSFLTFDWHITWIIWPVAALINYVVKNTCSEEI